MDGIHSVLMSNFKLVHDVLWAAHNREYIKQESLMQHIMNN